MNLRTTRLMFSGSILLLSSACGGDKPIAPAPEVKAATQPSAQAEPKPAVPAAGTCESCRAYWCTNWEGVDLVAGCFKSPDAKYVPKPDAKFAEDCTAVMKCAFKNNCGFDRARGPVECYCGSKFVDECKTDGPAKDAPCVAEWQAATRSKDNMEVLLRFDDIERPSGWAFHLMECDRERCGATSPKGRCTP